MATSSEQFNEKDALALIESTIQTARNKFNENGFIFLLWGWIILAANLVSYYWFLEKNFMALGITWMSFCTVGGIISGVYNRSHEKKIKVKTHVDSIMNHTWAAIGIGGGLLYIYLIVFGPHHLIGPFVLSVVGIGTYITGRTLRFMPLVLGGFAFWAFMVASLFVSNEWQFILGAAAMVPGYLVPGYMLRALYNRQNHAEEA